MLALNKNHVIPESKNLILRKKIISLKKRIKPVVVVLVAPNGSKCAVSADASDGRKSNPDVRTSIVYPHGVRLFASLTRAGIHLIIPEDFVRNICLPAYSSFFFLFLRSFLRISLLLGSDEDGVEIYTRIRSSLCPVFLNNIQKYIRS